MRSNRAVLITLAAIFLATFVLSGCNRGVGPPAKEDPNVIHRSKKGD